MDSSGGVGAYDVPFGGPAKGKPKSNSPYGKPKTGGVNTEDLNETDCSGGGSVGAFEAPMGAVVKKQIPNSLSESVDFVSEYVNKDDTFKYMLLSRMKSDCEYFLNYGQGSNNHLFMGNVADQITLMNALWDSFTEKPEWLSKEQIGEYAQKMGATTSESINESNIINPKYTHFAVDKETGKVVNGWDYNGYDSEDLKIDKKYYFSNDLIDMDVDPKSVKILTAKSIQKSGLNPFDEKSWKLYNQFGRDEQSITETEYKLKVPAPPTPAPAPIATEPSAEDNGSDAFANDNEEGNPFEDEKFDAGIDVNEEEDPKKYLEKLTGKLAQTLRTYSDDNGPDFDLEKYILNSIISASHTSEMEEDDRNKIVQKLESAGTEEDNGGEQPSDAPQTPEELPSDSDTAQEDQPDFKTEAFDLDAIVESEIRKIMKK